MRFTMAAIALLATGSAGDALAAAPGHAIPKATAHGYSLLKVGETRQKVLTLLGRNFTVCPTCAPVTWVYRTGLNDPIAIVVRFEHGAVASDFLVRPQPNV
jgi:hypothetical protein